MTICHGLNWEIKPTRISCYFTFDTIFGTTFGARKLFSKKIHSRGKLSKYCTSRVLYIPFYSPNSPIFGAKPLPRRRFLQPYYRGAFTESPQISHRCACDLFYVLLNFLTMRIVRAQYSECVPSHSFRSPNLQHAYSTKMKRWLFIQISPINHHFTNYSELEENRTVKDFLIVRQEGNRQVQHNIAHCWVQHYLQHSKTFFKKNTLTRKLL